MTDWLADGLLLARLGDALTLDSPQEPTAQSVHALRQAVTARRVQVVRPRPPFRTRARLAAVAVLGTTTLGAGVAFAAGAPLPGAIRSLASGLGLPVDSPAVSATRHAEHALQLELHAVSTHRPDSAQAAAVAKDATTLSHRLAQLAPADRQRLGTTPDNLLTQAKQLVPSVTTPPPGTASTPPPGVTTTVPVPRTTPPGVTIPSVTLPSITVPIPGGTQPTGGAITLPRVTVTVPKLPGT